MFLPFNNLFGCGYAIYRILGFYHYCSWCSHLQSWTKNWKVSYWAFHKEFPHCMPLNPIICRRLKRRANLRIKVRLLSRGWMSSISMNAVCCFRCGQLTTEYDSVFFFLFLDSSVSNKAGTSKDTNENAQVGKNSATASKEPAKSAGNSSSGDVPNSSACSSHPLWAEVLTKTVSEFLNCVAKSWCSKENYLFVPGFFIRFFF